MEYLGLIFEMLILFGAAYIYLLCRGLVKGHSNNAFIEKNRTLLRFLSLALIAIMALNIFLHLSQLF